MILAELFDVDTEEFVALIICNDKTHFQQFVEIARFEKKLDMDVVDFGDKITFQ